MLKHIRELIMLGLVTVSMVSYGYTHEWADDAATQQWFESRVQPDAPAGHSVEWLVANGWSCCGEADSYWVDDFERTPDGSYVAIITDGRTRQHRSPGTRIVVPQSKIAREGNPTGHGIIFMPVTGADHPVLGYNGAPIVPYCFYPPGGV